MRIGTARTHHCGRPADWGIRGDRPLRGQPMTVALVVEFSVAFSILIAFIVFGVFVFRIRERFDTVDVGALDRFRGERSDHL